MGEGIMKKYVSRAVMAVLAVGAAACQQGMAGNTAQGEPGSGIQTASAAVPNPAMSAPDQTAWNIFIAAVKPSGSSATTFETWASDTKTFAPPPSGGPKALTVEAPNSDLRPPIIPSLRHGTRTNAGGAGTQGGARALVVGASAPSGGGSSTPPPGQPPNPPPPGVNPGGPNDNGCDNKANPQSFEPACEFNPTMTVMENVRRNQPTYDYIVKNHLNSMSGLIKAYQSNFVVDFPTDSIEVKMNWIPVAGLATYYPGVAQDQFYVTTFTVKGVKQQYALIAMHAISKQVPNWTWATFEHRANRGRCDFVGCHDAFGATVQNVPAANNAGYGQQNQGTVYAPCQKSAALLAAFKAAGVAGVFNNYCLKGAQTDFTDNTGLAVRLGNSVTENGFVPQASCMSCHGEANFTNAGKPTSNFGFLPAGPNGNGQIGAINPVFVGYWKLAGSAPPYTPYQGMPGLTRNAASADFVWSVPFCAYDDVTDPKNPKANPNCVGK
jgi:hypothetical protein